MFLYYVRKITPYKTNRECWNPNIFKAWCFKVSSDSAEDEREKFWDRKGSKYNKTIFKHILLQNIQKINFLGKEL